MNAARGIYEPIHQQLMAEIPALINVQVTNYILHSFTRTRCHTSIPHLKPLSKVNWPLTKGLLIDSKLLNDVFQMMATTWRVE